MASCRDLNKVAAVILVCSALAVTVMTEKIARGTAEMVSANCADGQNCSNCLLYRGPVPWDTSGAYHCCAIKGGSGSGSARVCIWSSIATMFCQKLYTGKVLISCSGANCWDYGPQNNVTGNCDTACPCSGTVTATGAFNIMTTC